MRKTCFTTDEYSTILKLVKRKVEADRDTQTKIRNQIRKIGFRWSELSPIKSGFNEEGVKRLLTEGRITVGNKSKSVAQIVEVKSKRKPARAKRVNTDLFQSAKYVQQAQLNPEDLEKPGIYSLKLKRGAMLPSRYQQRLDERLTDIIYIGKAQGQSLGKRLSQELQHTSPGSFFRSIGAVLEFRPIKGSLRNVANKKNYKFSDSDTKEIIEWLESNVEVCAVPYSGDFSIEKQIIMKYEPLLNHTGNPRKCRELIEDRKFCRTIAQE